MDGFSYCGPRTLSISGQPDWVTLVGEQLTLTSSSVFDFTDTVTLTFRVVLDNYSEASATTTFDVTLTCPAELTCYDSNSKTTPALSDIPFVNPIQLACVEGHNNSNPAVEVKFVDKQGYRLSRVKMWKNEFNTAGFELTFSPVIPNAIDWNPVSIQYGYTDEVSELEAIDIDYDLAKIGICVDDNHNSLDHIDFEGFKFFNSDNVDQTISPNCFGEFVEFDLTS